MSSTEEETNITAPTEPEMSDANRNKWLSLKWWGFCMSGGATLLLTYLDKMTGAAFGTTIVSLYAIFCGVNYLQKKVFNG